MSRVLALPARGDVMLDARGEGRALRLSWHHEQDMVVLSLWAEGTCTGTFQLPAADVPQLVHALTSGLADGYLTGVDRKVS